MLEHLQVPCLHSQLWPAGGTQGFQTPTVHPTLPISYPPSKAQGRATDKTFLGYGHQGLPTLRVLSDYPCVGLLSPLIESLLFKVVPRWTAAVPACKAKKTEYR